MNLLLIIIINTQTQTRVSWHAPLRLHDGHRAYETSENKRTKTRLAYRSAIFRLLVEQPGDEGFYSIFPVDAS